MRDSPTIYFIRHGETDWNRDRRYQGQRDIPLNETGRTQAQRNGRALRAFLPAIGRARFIASPLQRTRETMEIIRSELDLPADDYQTDSDLVELSYGQWEGTLQDDLAAHDPEGLVARQADPFRWRPEGGESYADLFARVERWARTVTEDVVVVSHGGVSRCLRGHLLALDPLGIPDLESPQDRVLILAKASMRWL
ncbi:histidine phosphatase family protein [Hyphomicrobium sp.]|uniref:histidine phosphatase family protein n=1 Tax=Hyphomicrobium sp. TaxID=82 RepID=UPI002BAFFCD6|nr:histidine phosphatase family protein [Hyphomicrobium sp.]HRN87421.1 histidine phosphatase family protein [Hyphomicrobium sp.]HRQ26145.1 histidine phosphatase family protein [Hyphomicrobium sp.]